MISFNIYINKILHLFQVRKIKTKEKVVFLTFDDGPEPGITEFILSELSKYNAKATFFCRGDNAELYPNLLCKIKEEGHVIGNHTYNHVNSFETSVCKYVENVEKANHIIKSRLFRPTYGCITILTQCKLHRSNYKIVHWSLASGDTSPKDFNEVSLINRLKAKTSKGDIVLFHFCNKHENETKILLPQYLEWLYRNGYRSDVINL